MIAEIYTIGFTKKSAQVFFESLKKNEIDVVLDIRLNNTSQLAAFAKSQDIEYFLRELCNIFYIHDTNFSPTDETLKSYKSKEIDWKQYVEDFKKTMADREIRDYIKKHYNIDKKICLLCTEENANQCHRSLVANEFKAMNKDLKIIDL